MAKKLSRRKTVRNKKGVNVKAKDRLFVFIFGREENKKWTLQLYNAINHSDYTDPSEIEINTIENQIYLGKKNDVSFIIDSVINIYEHQGSYNPNMPVRELSYLGNLYDKYIKQNSLNRYSGSQLSLPVPKLLVFYNGKDKDIDDEKYLFLSDSFRNAPKGVEPDVSVRVRMLNINKGHNKELLEACKPLYEYSWFIDRVRENRGKYTDLKAAVSDSIDEMPDDFELKPFLMAHRAEVTGLDTIEEYDEEEVKQMFYRDGYEDAKAECAEEISKRDEEISKRDEEISKRDEEISSLRAELAKYNNSNP